LGDILAPSLSGKAGSPVQPRAANGRAEGVDTPRGPEAPSNESPRAAPVPPSFNCNLLKRKAKPGLCFETGCGSRVWYFCPTVVWCRPCPFWRRGPFSPHMPDGLSQHISHNKQWSVYAFCYCDAGWDNPVGRSGCIVFLTGTRNCLFSSLRT